MSSWDCSEEIEDGGTQERIQHSRSVGNATAQTRGWLPSPIARHHRRRRVWIYPEVRETDFSGAVAARSGDRIQRPRQLEAFRAQTSRSARSRRIASARDRADGYEGGKQR